MSTRRLNRRTSPIWKTSDNEFIQVLNESGSFAEAMTKLGVKSKGANYKTLHARIKEIGINISDIKNKYARIQKQKMSFRFQGPPINEMLTKNSKHTRSYVKKRLLKEGLLKNSCSMCGLGSEWNSKPLILHIDHINGVSDDNRLENLRMLCPNCHSQTETYAGKHRKKKHFCKECDKETKGRGQDGLCTSCSQLRRNHSDWPPIEELIKMVEETNYSATGRKLGVSDNAIRKHIKRN